MIKVTNDIKKEADNFLLAENIETKKLKSDVLIVPNYGSKTSSKIAFIVAIWP